MSTPNVILEMNPHQWEAFEFDARQREYDPKSKLWLAVGGAPRTGKSKLGFYLARRWMGLEKGHIKENTHGFVGRWDGTQLAASTIKDWFTEFPDDENYFFNTPGERHLEVPGNRRVEFGHLSDLTHHKNTGFDWFWMEQGEEANLKTFLYLRLRCSKPGSRGLVTYNPVVGADWIDLVWGTNEEMANQPPDAKHELTGRPHNSHYKLYTATAEVNVKNVGVEYLEDMKDIAELDPEVGKQMVEGQFDRSAGRVYKTLRRDIHVIEPKEIPPEWDSIELFDWGSTAWFVWLQSFITPNGDIIIAQEKYEHETLIEDYCNDVRFRRGNIAQPRFRIIDTPDQKIENKGFPDNGLPRMITLHQEFGRCGMPGKRPQKSIEAGIEEVNKYLKIDPGHVHPFKQEKGAPKLYIFNTCPNLIRQMFGYKRPPKSSKFMTMHDAPELPIHKDCDGCDLVRYLCSEKPVATRIVRARSPMALENLLDEVAASDRRRR